MGVYLSADGGGSKLVALLFDDKFKILGRGAAGGVNINQTTETDARQNVKDCLDQLFAEYSPITIDKVYIVFVGIKSFLVDEINRRCKANDIIILSEAEAGLMAGALWRSGLAAVCGTGSDVFYVPGERPPKQIKPYANRSLIVGGWGPIIGDDGSGTWIGRQAIRAAIAWLEGWGEPTLLLDMIRREWHTKDDWDMVGIVYQSPSPFRKVASLAPVAAAAAFAGDTVATRILEDAAKLMVTQTECLLDRFEIPEGDYRLVCCGGVWKAHPLIYRIYRECLTERRPGLSIRKPRFEHVMAGPAYEMLPRTGDDAAAAENSLAALFPEFVI